MTIEEQIYRYAQQLPPELRAELLDVAEYLALKAEQRERQLWNAFSTDHHISISAHRSY